MLGFVQEPQSCTPSLLHTEHPLLEYCQRRFCDPRVHTESAARLCCTSCWDRGDDCERCLSGTVCRPRLFGPNAACGAASTIAHTCTGSGAPRANLGACFIDEPTFFISGLLYSSCDFALEKWMAFCSFSSPKSPHRLRRPRHSHRETPHQGNELKGTGEGR